MATLNYGPIVYPGVPTHQSPGLVYAQIKAILSSHPGWTVIESPDARAGEAATVLLTATMVWKPTGGTQLRVFVTHHIPDNPLSDESIAINAPSRGTALSFFGNSDGVVPTIETVNTPPTRVPGKFFIIVTDRSFTFGNEDGPYANPGVFTIQHVEAADSLYDQSVAEDPYPIFALKDSHTAGYGTRTGDSKFYLSDGTLGGGPLAGSNAIINPSDSLAHSSSAGNNASGPQIRNNREVILPLGFYQMKGSGAGVQENRLVSRVLGMCSPDLAAGTHLSPQDSRDWISFAGWAWLWADVPPTTGTSAWLVQLRSWIADPPASSAIVPGSGSALNVINDAAVELGLIAADLPDPFASTDPNIVRLCRLLTSLGRELALSFSWTQLQKIYTFQTSPGQTNYSLPADFNGMVDQSSWNRTTRLPVGGPISGQAWEYLLALPNAATLTVLFRKMQGQLVLYPTPGTIQTIAFEYASSYWVQPYGATTATSDRSRAATDTLLFDWTLLVLGLKMKFLESKGFPAEAARADFISRLEQAREQDPSPALTLDGNSRFGPLLSEKNIPNTGWGK